MSSEDDAGHPLDAHYNLGKKRARQDSNSEDVITLTSEDEDESQEGDGADENQEDDEAESEEGEIEAHEIIVVNGDDDEYNGGLGEQEEVVEVVQPPSGSTAATARAVAVSAKAVAAQALSITGERAQAAVATAAAAADMQGGQPGDEQEEPSEPTMSRAKRRRRSQAAAAAAADAGADAAAQPSEDEAVQGAAAAVEPASTFPFIFGAGGTAHTRSITALTKSAAAPVGVLLIDDLSELTRDTEVSKLLRVPRYFDDDAGTRGGVSSHSRCFRCGEIGHFASDCTNKERLKPCFLCAQLGHDGRECPNRLCFKCGKNGHQARECPNTGISGVDSSKKLCLRCGLSSCEASGKGDYFRYDGKCTGAYSASDLLKVKCQACGRYGHLCCKPSPQAGHLGETCSQGLRPHLMAERRGDEWRQLDLEPLYGSYESGGGGRGGRGGRGRGDGGGERSYPGGFGGRGRGAAPGRPQDAFASQRQSFPLSRSMPQLQQQQQQQQGYESFNQGGGSRQQGGYGMNQGGGNQSNNNNGGGGGGGGNGGGYYQQQQPQQQAQQQSQHGFWRQNSDGNMQRGGQNSYQDGGRGSGGGYGNGSGLQGQTQKRSRGLEEDQDSGYQQGGRGAGGGKVLVNNAGAYGRRLPLSELTAEDMLYAFKVNALGPFLCVQQLCNRGLLGSVPSTGSPSPPPAAAAPATPEQLPLRSPSTTSLIVNISSIVASHGDTTVSATSPSGYAYRASKAALNIMSKSFTIDLGKSGVRSVLIHPGYVQTDLTGGAGWVSVEQSTDGIMAVLEGAEPLDGRFLSYTGEQIPW
ncbi:MAG: hypothetical protein WDW38_006335 [Sanguina aurantia]